MAIDLDVTPTRLMLVSITEMETGEPNTWDDTLTWQDTEVWNDVSN